MKELLENINAHIDAFKKDAALQCEKGNKAAGMRARKEALAIGKLMSQFRKESVAATK